MFCWEELGCCRRLLRCVEASSVQNKIVDVERARSEILDFVRFCSECHISDMPIGL